MLGFRVYPGVQVAVGVVQVSCKRRFRFWGLGLRVHAGIQVRVVQECLKDSWAWEPQNPGLGFRGLGFRV